MICLYVSSVARALLPQATPSGLGPSHDPVGQRAPVSPFHFARSVNTTFAPRPDSSGRGLSVFL